MESPWLDRRPAVVSDHVKRPLVGFAARGDTKLTPKTLAYLAHVELGEPLSADDLPRLHDAILSSELFEQVEVTLERAPDGDGVILAAELVDKHSWVVAPTVYVLPGGTRAAGFGFAENDWGGLNRKLLLYGQISNASTFFFGTYLDPAVHGSKLTWRLDVYPLRRVIKEYLNPTAAPTSFDVARRSTLTFWNAGALIGWNFAWWLVGDLRLRSAWTSFSGATGPNGAPAKTPEKNGWDTSLQARLTLDARHHEYGVTWGPYVQLWLESTIPGLDDYGYQDLLLRAYYAWRLDRITGRGHQLELRTHVNLGRHLPLHEDLTLGGIYDIRGYPTDQFRGDTRFMWRAEYSWPIARWRIFAFRLLGFADAGYIALEFPRTGGDRDYLAGPGDVGAHWFRSDVGAGLRIYVKNVVLPLLGFDVAYGIEGRTPAVTFEVGLTDF